MTQQSSRGALIVIEGLDRSGKSSQCESLVKHLNESGHNAQYVKFPDRTTPTGQMINSYLTGNAQQDDHSIHLLFSANRWEAIQGILKTIEAGTSVVVDRFSFSGAVYSAAKENPNLGLDWAWGCEVGLPKPDVIIFLDISSEDAAKRGGYGEERYETEKMQSKVRDLFQHLFARLQGLNIQRVNAGRSIADVSADVTAAVDQLLQSEVLNKPPEKLQALSG